METPDKVPARTLAAISGGVAGAAGIAVSELVAGMVAGAPSLVLSIGALIIELQPPGAKSLMVGLFGTADKLALNIGIVLVAVMLAGALGILARRHTFAARVGFGAAGLLGLLASLREPLIATPLAVVTAMLAVVVALSILHVLFRFAGSGKPMAEMPDWARRRFVGTSVATAGAAAVSGAIGRYLLTRDQPTTLASVPSLDIPSPPPLPDSVSLDILGLTPIVVPNDRFYRIDTRLLVPQVDVANWRLTVTGMVDHELTLTYNDLLEMPNVARYVTIACVSNEVGGGLVGNAWWGGVNLAHVLEMAGVQAGATQVVGRAFDGWTGGFPTAWIDETDHEGLIALSMNGQPLPAEHGYPARLIIPGLFGYVSATKWLTNIELTTLESFDAYWVPLGWSKRAPIVIQSRIDTPRHGATLRAGTIPIAGVAWGPDQGISLVEVRVDDGPWVEARRSQPISEATWIQYVRSWDASPGTHRISVRATAGNGETQIAERTPPAPDGATGYHTIAVRVV